MIRAGLWQLEFARAGLYGSWRDASRFRRLSPSEARRDLSRRLLAQVQYFGARADALPEWRDAARIRDPDDLLRVWPSLPIVTKRDLRDRFPATEIASRFQLEGRMSSTGGSTGEPTVVFHDTRMIRAMGAARVYARRQLGWRPGAPVIYVWGAEGDIGRTPPLTARLKESLQNFHSVAGYSLDASTVDRFLDLLRSHRRPCVYGFTSMLEYVARATLARGASDVHGRIHAAWNGGEMLLPEQSTVFERAFGVPILNMYGGRELGALAMQSEAGTSLRVLRPWVMVEIVDDSGSPVSPGESGRILLTSTACRGTPFLRYDVGDLGSALGYSRDESGILAIDRLEGRSAGLLHLPNGKTVNALYWNHLLKDFPEIEQFQVALTAEQVELRLKGTAFTPSRELALRASSFTMLGNVPLSIVWVNDIPRTKQGKLVQVVRE